MNTLVVMRHAESVFNERGILNGDASLREGLTQRGREQARMAGVQLATVRLDLCVTTTFQRTIETADIVLAGRTIPRLVMRELDDCPSGDFELQPYENLEAWHAGHGPDDHIPGTRTTLRGYFEVNRAGFLALASRPEESALAVIHGLTLSWLIHSIKAQPIPDQGVPVVLSWASIKTMIKETDDDVLRFWHK